MIYIDIDRMRLNNETCGCKAGDEVIVRVASVLAPPVLPKAAIAVRIGGDRFGGVSPDHDSEQARACSEHLQLELAKFSLGAETQVKSLSVSCGIGRLQNKKLSFGRALAAAELACKSEGKVAGHVLRCIAPATTP